jgi:hypothetical protein
MGILGIAAKLPLGPPLAQEIPRLIQLYLNFRQARVILIGGSAVLKKVVLFLDELLDVAQHGLITALSFLRVLAASFLTFGCFRHISLLNTYWMSPAPYP